MDSILSVELYFRSIKRTEMYAELYEYLLHYKTLPVPGIGTFLLERKPATGDFPNRVFRAPAFGIVFKKETEPFPKHFFSRLGNILGISDRDASNRFREFTDSTSSQLQKGDRIHWTGVGSITRAEDGEIRFNPDEFAAEDPVKAGKVIREHATHTVRVGEDEKSSEEMTRMLNTQVTRRSYGWLLPTGLLLVAALFIGWHLFNRGFEPASSGNNTRIVPVKESAGHRVLSD